MGIKDFLAARDIRVMEIIIAVTQRVSITRDVAKVSIKTIVFKESFSIKN